MTREEFLNEKNTSYSDWFGEGDLIKVLLSEEKRRKQKAKYIYRDSYMILIQFSDAFVCCGYDGNEYEHGFNFELKKT